jgi:hypothetical protein
MATHIRFRHMCLLDWNTPAYYTKGVVLQQKNVLLHLPKMDHHIPRIESDYLLTSVGKVWHVSLVVKALD